MRDVDENEFQDYLDGRMTGSRRRAFEERIAADDDLARRMREHRAAGAALRSGTEELSPDFYARLRARFEQSARKRHVWLRLLSWETAGLAAAVVIAVALFVPFVIEKPADRTEPPPGPARQRTAYGVAGGGDAGQAAAAKKQEAAPSRPPEGRVESNARTETRASEVLDLARPGPAAPANEPEGQEEKERAPRRDGAEDAPPAWAAEPGQKTALESREARAPEPGSPSPAPSAATDDATGGRSADLRRQALGSTAGFLKARSSQDEESSGRTVPSHVVEPGTWRRIDAAEAWSELEQEAAVGVYDPSRQIVLVGDRNGGLDCAGSVVRETAEAHEIRLTSLAPGSPRDGHGCAFVLPRDGRTVLVLGPEERP